MLSSGTISFQEENSGHLKWTFVLQIHRFYENVNFAKFDENVILVMFLQKLENKQV